MCVLLHLLFGFVRFSFTDDRTANTHQPGGVLVVSTATVHIGPKPAPGSNQVEWYTNMDKHRRWSIVIDAGPEIGIVGMAPVGFWGVGSMRVYIEVGDVLERGDYIGHFLYGGSSIMLCFEPGKKFNWVDEDGRMINNVQFPNQVDVRAKIGELMVVKD